MEMIKKILKRYNDIPVAAKATLWFMFCNIVQKGISLLTTPIFTRLMTVEQYGQFSVYNSWLSIFTIFTTLRLNYAIFNKGMSKYKENRDDYTATMQSITFLLALCAFVIYLMFRNYFNNLTGLPTFIMVAIFTELLVTPAIDFWTLRKRYEYQYKPVVVRTLVMAFLNAFIGVIAVLLNDEKGYARILTCVGVNLIFGVWLFAVNRTKSKVWLNRDYAKFAIMFNLPLFVHYMSVYILDQFDRIMIQKMVSIAAAGIYSVAYNVGMLMKIVTQSINSALVPWQYEMLEKRQFKRVDDLLFVVYILIAGVALMLSCFAPEAMRILANEKYYGGVYCIPPVALGLVFSFMYTTFANVEIFYGLNKFTMYVSLAGAVLNIVLNYIGIQLFGYTAAAYTTLLCYVVFAAAHYVYMTVYMRKTQNVERVFQTKRLVILSACILTVGIFVIFIYDYWLARYLFVAALGIIAVMKRDRLKGVLKVLKSR